MRDVTPAPRREPSRLLLGVLLIVLGIGLLLLNFGIALPRFLWRYYPFPLLALGVIGLVFPSRHLSRSAGVWLLAAGLYGVCGLYNVFGLGWLTAWPLFVIAAGADFAFSRSNWDGVAHGEHARSAESDAARAAESNSSGAGEAGLRSLHGQALPGGASWHGDGRDANGRDA